MAERVSILAVLVLYQRSLEESVTWKALVSRVDAALQAETSFRLLVCENGVSSSGHAVPALPEWAEYVGVEGNHGVAWAYNLGIQKAAENGADWLLTLDQDTALPPDFLARVAARVRETQNTSVSRPVVAIVPQLISGDGRALSPAVATLAGERAVGRGFQGRHEGEVRAYNSGALIRVDALKTVGGYDRRFWLDYADHVLFHALHRSGGRVWVEGGLQLRHRLSLDDDRESLGEERFRNFSAAEAAFRDLYGSGMAALMFTARLMLRVLSQKRRGDPEHFARTTLSVLRARLTMSRKERIVRWEAADAARAAEPEIVSQVRARFTDAQR